MRIIIGTAFGSGMKAGGLRSHIESLKHILSIKGIHSELIYPDNDTMLWKWKAALRALGNIDHARVELTKIRINNVGQKVQKIISMSNLDLIHTHDVLLANWAVKLAIPVILTVHGPLYREAIMLGKGTHAYLSYLKEIELQAYQAASAIITVDTGQKDIIISDYHIPPEKIRVIYNAVDVNLFAPQPSQEKGHKPFFLVPRRLVPKNGVHVAVEAFRFIEDKEVELWIAGDGPERSYLERLVKKLGLSTKIRFLGSVDRNKIIKLMNASIGIIIPSIPVCGVIEATSIAALEGMSMGKPVFASNIGGLAEMIKNGKTGFLFEAGDPNALGMLLRHALLDTEWSQTVGRKARKYVIANHNLEIWAKQIIEVYQNALRT